MSGGDTFDQNRIYHSYLKAFSPIVVRFTSDVRESDYDGHIRWFEVRGDDHDGYYYQVENDEIRQYLEDEVPTGEWIKLVASGDGREGTADMEVHPADGPDTSYSSPSQGGSGGGGNEPRLGPDNILDQYDLVLEKAKERFPEVMLDDDGELTEVGARLATTLYIQWSRTGRKAPLFDGQGEDVAEPQHADRIEEDIDTLDWDGNSHDGRDLSDMKVRLSTLAEDIREGKATLAEAEHAINWLNNEVDEQSEDTTSPSLGEDSLPF